MDVVRKIMESVERADIKRLNLTSYFDPEERVVLEAFVKELVEGLRLFEEEMKAEEEEEEEAAKENSSEVHKEGSDTLMI
ncbi:hypothetical protein A2U01_0091750, partial [Trifolium medium]|nr:hypothetical protein [Trifolium medium]